MNYQETIEKLKEPIPYHWRVQSFSKRKPLAICVPYLDARQVMNRLDELGLIWQDKYKEVAGKVYCYLGIEIDGKWYWRMDVGAETKIERDKGQASDAFKRAAVKWGIGRFLYDNEIVPVVTLPANEKKTNDNFPYVVKQARDANGNVKQVQVWDLTKHINEMHAVASPGGKDPAVELNELHEKYLNLWKAYEDLVGTKRAESVHPDQFPKKDIETYTNTITWIEKKIAEINEQKNEALNEDY